MDEDKLEFVIAAKFNKKFRKLLKNHKMENGNTSNVFEYKFKCRRSTFNILAILNQDKEYSLLQQIKVGSINKFSK